MITHHQICNCGGVLTCCTRLVSDVYDKMRRCGSVSGTLLASGCVCATLLGLPTPCSPKTARLVADLKGCLYFLCSGVNCGVLYGLVRSQSSVSNGAEIYCFLARVVELSEVEYLRLEHRQTRRRGRPQHRDFLGTSMRNMWKMRRRWERIFDPVLRVEAGERR